MATGQTTDERILTAFSELLLNNGYEGTTTRKIADQAGVNESTIFRHFKDKRGILTTLIDRYLVDINQLGMTFSASGDITVDLIWVAQTYRQFVESHQSLFLLGLRNAYQFPEIADAIKQLPARLKKLLIEKLGAMVKSGEVRADVDLDVVATNFILLNFGNAVFKYAYPGSGLDVPLPEFSEKNIRSFADGLKRHAN